MKHASLLLSLGLLVISRASAQKIAAGRFTPAADGQTVHDAVLHVTWLADLNLPATQKYGLSIKPGGAMTYQVARQWVTALNRARYLGHSNWTLPATPVTDKSCSVERGPHGNSFGFDCSNSTMGSLYYKGLGIKQPNTAVPMPLSRVGPFRNVQPYLYWSLTGKDRGQRAMRRENGDHAFSFNTGWQGGNVSDHAMYVWPVIPGALPGVSRGNGMELVPSADGETVYDPIANVTWLADANLAATNRFGVSGIVADGAMSRVTATDFIDAMNRKGHLGQKRWQLPATTDGDPSCSMKEGGYNCSGSPMGSLYYNHLVKLNDPVAIVPDAKVGPFHNLMPYLYWSCAGAGTACSGDPAAPGFQWSFSFGNGFQGTDVIGNSLYVMVYAPDQ